jgi:hypothetical protein
MSPHFSAEAGTVRAKVGKSRSGRRAARGTRGARVASVVDAALDAGEGVLRLAPNWVPRSFLHPGRRLRLHPDDYYAFGAARGGIDERWFSSTIEAANEGRTADEGLSYVVHAGARVLLRDAVEACGETLLGATLWRRHRRWPVFAKFFDNAGPIPHHMHQSDEQAARVGQQGKPEAYFFPPQMNPVDHAFPHTFFGLEPGTTKGDVRRCLERWNEGDNGILDLSRAYRLKRGTGWLVGPGILHAPGSLLTFEPQWASDVFGVFQSLVEGRTVPWDLCVRDVPKQRRRDLDYLVDQLDWDANVDPNFKANHYLEPVVDAARSGDGATDRFVVYGTIAGKQLFSAKELTLAPGARWTLADPGASGWITIQGRGRVGALPIHAATQLRFGEMSHDELFISHDAARAGSHGASSAGLLVENTGDEPLVALRYFGPDVHAALPEVGAHRH